MAGVYDEILTWSTGLPLWQRDALRRLASGPLTSADIDELVHLCLSEAGLPTTGSQDLHPQPLLQVP